MSPARERVWHFLAGASFAFGGWYLTWRWTQSLNPDNLVFSVLVASAETLFFVGTLLTFFDIWREQDSPRTPAPRTRKEAALDDACDAIVVDVFIATFDETCAVVGPTVEAAVGLQAPENTVVRVHILDDGNRLEMEQLAGRFGVGYITRCDNVGFKAGNLRNALFQTSGDFVLICDADTRVFPEFLENTLGYFRDSKVAWVQTPHWFYDIPEGETWEDWAGRHTRHFPNAIARFMRFATARSRVGNDPFLSDPTLFFDVILRRRNRNGAAFCCGAGSVHRREAIFSQAIDQKAKDLNVLTDRHGFSGCAQALSCVRLEPYRFHVSEDIYTSILLHENRDAEWKSVFHPKVEARMLSPWSMKAWATQRLKYGGGTFDIMLRDNPLWRRGMSWQAKLHYAATFWSYLSVLWVPILLLAPVAALLFGLSPVSAYSAEFFLYFVPAILITEAATVVACKGYNVGKGRALALATLPLNLRALWLAICGERPSFPTTPKSPGNAGAWKFVWPNIALISLMVMAGTWGVFQTVRGVDGFGLSMLAVNLFWLVWNISLNGHLVLAAFWKPMSVLQRSNHKETEDENAYSSPST
ncbi:cellulose synthase (UDP-forming) [Shimia isoporae]|uniref:Cellulose synthase (UDP-forming) n=1 Tax=Shimia isoporae TaxID=647720 RepID=A0A4R1N356_9RHOB|nr:glycosyltransferase [Shimia isoporae]TCL01137.1 cellulose synthase (UDP-forming) [Shimia isoporae]